jgi:putative ABC transport system permease protein
MNLWHDIRYGARMLCKSPGFVVTAVVTLGIGIGATTAIFSICDSLLWKPAPLPRMDSLVMVLEQVQDSSNEWNSVTPADLNDIGHDNTALASVASWQGGLANIVAPGGEPDRVIQTLVSANFFEVAGVQPALGRAFQTGEDQPGREREVILSDRTWKRRFGADPAIIGKSMRLDDENYLITGVMPANYDFPLATEIWTPVALKPAQRGSRSAEMLTSIGRLKPGRTIQQAAAELDSTGARLAKAYPETNKNRRFMLWSALKFLTDPMTKQYLVMTLGSVFFVLLIACVNVANLQFARATGRLREVAVRTALGAGRARIVVQLLTESILLSLLGAAFGLVVAKWGIDLMKNGMPPEIQRYILGWKEIHLDSRALLFTLAAAILSGILAGLTPAWQCSRPNLTGALKEGGRGTSSGRGRHRLRNVLVAAEIALAVVLLVGAGLMVRGFRSMLDYGVKLEPSTLLTLRLAITDNKYREPHQVAGFYHEVLDRIAAIPGVRSAVVATALPYSDHSNGRNFTIEGQPLEPGNPPAGMYQVVNAAYFETLHIPLRAGRLMSDRDSADAPKVAFISERMSRRWWKNESPIGRRIKIGGPDSKAPWLTIAGVVGDIMHSPYDRDPRRTIYLPYQQAPALWMDIGVRTAGDPLLLAPAVTAAIRSVDAEQPINDMMTMEKSIHNRAIGLNYMAVLMGIFGALAMGLAAIGVYGVMAFMVTEQSHEIGVRMALGASRQNVLAAVFRRGMLTIGAGLLVGLPLAYGFARLMASLIFGVTTTDATSFVGIPLALIAAAALAIYIPARRAMNIDPIVALRYE